MKSFYIEDTEIILLKPGELGATRALIKSAIDFLLAKGSTPGEPPEKKWFSTWLKTRKYDLRIHEIKTKPIVQECLESHFSVDIKEWFIGYRNWIRIRKIRKPKRVWNMDETRESIECPLAEKHSNSDLSEL
ncbi:putative multidrug resistance protein fnx1 [Erysiphe neolycopersici]|uniref:Putative multidrug resistance protein fnx1 n=1 Tax=Erysiphe neolycopersici TaxID=212602 RepID=A0A420HUK4_9PEZI|nr:putative multidrug resistance protein fnx1 [Erysiphe neolycopersici]